MLNGHIFHPPLRVGLWLKFGLGIVTRIVTVTAMALSQVHAHDSPQHTIPTTPALDIMVNQLTVGVSSTRRDANIAKQRTQFTDQKIQLIEYNSTLQIKSNSASTAFFPQIPIRVIAPNTLSQQQKQAKLQAQIQQTQQTVMHEQVSLLQQISQLEQQLSIRTAHIAKLDHKQQQQTLRNQNLLRQLQDLHVKYDHIINNYTVIPKF